MGEVCVQAALRQKAVALLRLFTGVGRPEMSPTKLLPGFWRLRRLKNPGNNFDGDISGLPTPVNSLNNATAFCLNAACTQTSPITSYQQLRAPAGALGDFFGPGTTVGIPFAAQLGLKLTF